MPAKRKPLPLPCPNCHKSFGSIQLQSDGFSDTVLLRVAHYDPILYKNPTTIRNSKKSEFGGVNFVQEKAKSKSRGKKWCFSRQLDKYEMRNFPEIKYLEEKLWRPGFKGKTVSCAISHSLYQEIKEKGWNSLPEYQSYEQLKEEIQSLELISNKNESSDFFKKNILLQLEMTIKVISKFLNKSIEHDLASKMSPKEFEEFCKTIEQFNTQLNAEKFFDRMITWKKLQKYIFITITFLRYLESIYILYIWNPSKLSSKQASKIIHLRTQKVPPLYDPKNQKEAVEAGFNGEQCLKCKSWRVDEKYVSIEFKTLHCFACLNEWNKTSKIPYSENNFNIIQKLS